MYQFKKVVNKSFSFELFIIQPKSKSSSPLKLDGCITSQKTSLWYLCGVRFMSWDLHLQPCRTACPLLQKDGVPDLGLTLSFQGTNLVENVCCNQLRVNARIKRSKEHSVSSLSNKLGIIPCGYGKGLFLFSHYWINSVTVDTQPKHMLNCPAASEEEERIVFLYIFFF